MTENIDVYLKLLAYAFVPVFFSALFYILEKKTAFDKMPYAARQAIIGIVFGGIAVLGTEFGVDIGGATANTRDAAPLCAGLLFGGPAGIIAGIIGGVERWFAVYWGAGMYSRVACSVSTILAGFYAAFLRKFMFDDKRPAWGLALVTGIVMEVVHMTILFLTHLNDAQQAYEIVKICTLPMVLSNSVAVMLATIAISIIGFGFHHGERRRKKISQKVQAWLLLTVVLAYFATTSFVYSLQTGTAVREAEQLLQINIEDVKSDIADAIENGTAEQDIREMTKYRHVGESGYILIADSDFALLSDSENHDGKNLVTAGIWISKNTDDSMHEASVYDEQCYWMYSTEQGYYVVAVLPQSEAFNTRDTSVYINSYMEVLVFAALFILIYYLIKKLVVDNIRSVNSSLSQIIGGNLDVTVDVRSSDEFASLSDDINSTVYTLKHYIADAAARIDEELTFAKNIQHSTLPSTFPAYPNAKEFDVYATMHTAKEVGGDFYDFYMIGDNKLAFLMADVSGKGIPAAMFMMTAKSIIKSYAEMGMPVNEVFTNANKKLCEENEAGMFVTAWMGILDINTGHVTYANAGHNPPLIYRKDKGFDYMHSKPGFVLAGIDGINYKLQVFDLNPGDRVFLYTDGVTEATDLQKRLYGEDRLLELLNAHTNDNVQEVLVSVKTDIDEFVGEAEQFDDITMLMLDFNGSQYELIAQKTFDADDAALDEANEFVEQALEAADCSPKTSMQVSIALEEIFVNIAHYAYPEGNGKADISVFTDNTNVMLRFADKGIPFDPLAKADPDVTLSAEERAIGGLGIYMVKKSMDDVRYEYKDGQNILTLIKKCR